MKKLFVLSVAAIAVAVALVACQKGGGTDNGGGGEEPGPTDVKVTGVAISGEENITKTEGDADFTLSATIAPADATNKNMAWSTDDPTNAVLTVSQTGVVHIVAPGGPVKITVTTEDGDFTDFVNVTVEADIPDPVPVESVTLDRNAVSLALGQTLEPLAATVLPEGADDPSVVWSSSDETVATVAEGVVTILKTGTVTITAASNEDNTIKDECVITVDGVLLNGLVWAEYNVDMPGTFADSPEKVGMFYQWGSNLGWSSGTGTMTASDGSTTWRNTQSSDATWPENTNPCPEGWSVPTIDQIYLISYTTRTPGTDNGTVKWEAAMLNGMGGVRFSDMTKPELSIFLPTDGYRMGMSNGYLNGAYNATTGSGQTHYWTSTPKGTANANRLQLSVSGANGGTPTISAHENTTDVNRNFADAIRCVKTVE